MKDSNTPVRNKKIGILFPLFAVILLLVGLGVFFYPTFSNYLAEKNQTEVIQVYENHVNSSDIDVEAEREKAIAYNNSLSGKQVQDVFAAGSGYVLPDNYREVLNIDGVMGYLEIPKISLQLPIYHGTSEEVLEKGIGHIESTALPIGGSGLHSVLTGHRGLPSAELFTRLDEMEPGDVFLLHVLGETLAYEVDQINEVLPNQLDLLRPVQGQDLVTLLTCTPYGVNTHRLLIRGHRVDYVPEELEPVLGGVEVMTSEFSPIYVWIGILLGAVALLVAFVLFRRFSKGKQHEE